MFRKGLKNSSILFSDSSADLYGKNGRENLLNIAFAEICIDEENVKKISEWMYDESKIGVFFIYGCNDETLTDRIISLEKETGEVIWYSPIRELPEDTFILEGADPECTYLSSAVINHKILKKDCTNYVVKVQGYNALEMKIKAVYTGEQKEEIIEEEIGVNSNSIDAEKEEKRSNESMQDHNDVSKLKEKFHREIDEKFRTGSIFNSNEEPQSINSLKRKELEDEIENNILNENILDEDMLDEDLLGDDMLDDDLLTSDLLSNDLLNDDLLSDDLLSDDLLSDDLLGDDLLNEDIMNEDLMGSEILNDKLEEDMLSKDIDEIEISDDIDNSRSIKENLFGEPIIREDDMLINTRNLPREDILRNDRPQPIERKPEPRVNQSMSATDMMVNNLLKERRMKESNQMATETIVAEKPMEQRVVQEPIREKAPTMEDDFMKNFKRAFEKEEPIQAAKIVEKPQPVVEPVKVAEPVATKPEFDLSFAREERIEKIQEFTDNKKFVNQFDQKQTIVNEFLSLYPLSITVNKATDKPLIKIDDNIIVEKVGNYYITIINGLAFKPIYLLEGEKQYFEFREGTQQFFEKVKTLISRMYGLEPAEFDNLKKLLILDTEENVEVPNLRIMAREASIELLESTKLNILDLSDKSLFISIRDENDLKTTIRYKGIKVNQNPEIIEKVERVNEMYQDIKMLGYSSIKSQAITSVARLLIDNLK